MDRSWKRFLLSTILLSLMILGTQLVTVQALSTLVERQGGEWPWGEKSEPFPWLDYLASLTDERGVTLTVISRHEATILEKARVEFLKSEVAKKLGIVDIVLVNVGPALWIDTIKRAEEAGNPYDIAWGGGPTLFNIIDEAGLVEPLDPNVNPAYYAILYEASKINDTLAGAPTKLYDENGVMHWVGSAISSFGFTVNHKKLEEFGLADFHPRKWSDLASPELARYLPTTPLVGIADPFMSTSNTRMYEIILQAYGWEEGWKVLTLMAANAKIYDSSSAVRDGVIIGEIAVGITIDFYGYTAMHQNPDCEYIIPEGESIVNADPIALLKGSKHKVHAAAFIAWVLSEYGGQQLWLDPDINRLPINDRVFDTPAGQQRPDLKQAYDSATTASVIVFNETRAALWERAMQTYFKATLVDAHDDLQDVWSAIAKAYLDGEITEVEFNYLVDELVKLLEFEDPITGEVVTFTEDYAAKINPYLGDAAIWNQLKSLWEEKAREKYQYVYELLQKIRAGEITITTTTTSPTTTTPTETTTPPTETTPTTSPTTTTPTETTTPPTETSPTTTTPTDLTRYYPVIGAIVLLIIIVVGYLLTRRK